MFSSANCPKLLTGIRSVGVDTFRSIWKYPPWTYNIRFDLKEGRKVPQNSALVRFKRLNSGMWIKTKIGRKTLLYEKSPQEALLYEKHYTCNRDENIMLEKLMTPYWLRPKYYLDDPYKSYHTRRGLKQPRVHKSGKLVRERPKILLEDCVADQHFYDR